MGFYDLGLLWRTKTIPNPQVFWCPAVKASSDQHNFDYYSDKATGGFPSTPAGSGDDNIRAGYNYYPQIIEGETVSSTTGITLTNVSKQYFTSGSIPLEIGAGLSKNLIPAKMSAVDPKKIISMDRINNYEKIPHRLSKGVSGMCTLFTDGHVVFQNARANGAAFDPQLWGTVANPIQNNPNNWRVVATLLK